MADTAVSVEDFQALILPLVGLTVSQPWKGHGSAIFLELGALAPLESRRRHPNKGDSEACIFVEWDWRVEAEAAVLYGSSNRRPKVVAGIVSLQGTTVQALTVVGNIPELVVQFSNGHCLRSMVMVTGNPEWSRRLPDERWVYAKSGHLLVGTGAESLVAVHPSLEMKKPFDGRDS